MARVGLVEIINRASGKLITLCISGGATKVEYQLGASRPTLYKDGGD
jgi:hypothetical protein